MGVQHQISKVLGSFKGLNLRSSELLKTSDYSTAMDNVIIRKNGALVKRKGFRSLAINTTSTGSHGFGLVNYKNVNISTGLTTEELITFGNETASKMETVTLVLTNTRESNDQATYFSNTVRCDNAVYLDIKANGSSMIATLRANERLLQSSKGDTSESKIVPVYAGHVFKAGMTLLYYDKNDPGKEQGTLILKADAETLEVEDEISVDDNYILQQVGVREIMSYDLGTGTVSDPSIDNLVTQIEAAVTYIGANVYARTNPSGSTTRIEVVAFGYSIEQFVVGDTVYAYYGADIRNLGTITAIDVGASTFDTNVNDTVVGTGGYNWRIYAYGPSITVGGTTSASIKAAVIDPQNNLLISNAATEINWYNETALTAPTGYTLDLNMNQLPGSVDENVSTTQLGDCLYIASGESNPIFKYDGTRIYKAGLPTPSVPSLAVNPSGPMHSGTFLYKIQYIYTDAKGNIIHSYPSTPAQAITIPSNNEVDVTVNNILNTSGYDTDSSNLKIRIWRTIDGASAIDNFYLANEVVNDGTTATQIVIDQLTDTQLQANEIFQEFSELQYSGIPSGKYITSHQGCLVVSGINSEPTTFKYSKDFNNPENFPVSGGQQTEHPLGSKITGLGTLNNNLYIFQDESVFSTNGTLSLGGLPLAQVGGDELVGCAAHASIKEIKGTLFFLSKRGIYAVAPGASITEVSYPIQPEFFNITKTFNFKKAVAMNWIKEDSYVLTLPVDSVISGPAAGTDIDLSETFVYNYFRKAWSKFKGIDLTGGVCGTSDSEYFFNSRGGDISVNACTLNKIKDTNTDIDYSDHEKAISAVYKTNWEHSGSPSIFKKYLKLKVHSYDTNSDFETSTFKLTTNIQTDYVDNTLATLTFDMSGGYGNGWGENAQYGNTPWGSVIIPFMKSKLPNKKCKSILIGFENNEVNSNILLSGYEVEVAAPYRAEIKE